MLHNTIIQIRSYEKLLQPNTFTDNKNIKYIKLFNLTIKKIIFLHILKKLTVIQLFVKSWVMKSERGEILFLLQYTSFLIFKYS